MDQSAARDQDHRDRERDPSLRPAGVLPVECAFFTLLLTEFARLDAPEEPA